MTKPFEFTADVAVGEWIAPRLGGEFGAAGLVCPRGFEAYARVFHPVGEKRLRWAQVCTETGRVPHPLMQWGHISGTLHGTRYFGDWDDGEPAEGNLGVDELATLSVAIGGDALITIGVWDGYGHLYPGGTSSFAMAFRPDDDVPPQPVVPDRDGFEPNFGVDARSAPTLALPGREYLLFRGSLDTLRDPDWPRASGWAWRWQDTLNLAWPDNHEWFVASEIDFDSTVVGGSRDMIDRVLTSTLETAEITSSSNLSWEGDLINPL